MTEERSPYNAKPQAGKVRQFTIRLPEKTHLDLKIRSVQDGKSMGGIVEQLITDYLKKR